MTPDLIHAAEARIRNRIDEIYCDSRGLAEPIYDGVVDAALYCATSPRIMWILKEPWDNADSSGGGWSLTADVLANKRVSELSHSTFHPIIYIAYGLLHGLQSFDALPWVRDMENPEGVLRRLAFINAKKLPGVTRGAYGPLIMEWYNRGRGVIHDQIDSYAPDIVFACSPHMPEILSDRVVGWRDQIVSVGSASSIHHKGLTYVHVYHPGQTQISRAKYVDDALAAVAIHRRETKKSNKAVDSTATRVTPPADPSLCSGQESRHGQP